MVVVVIEKVGEDPVCIRVLGPDLIRVLDPDLDPDPGLVHVRVLDLDPGLVRTRVLDLDLTRTRVLDLDLVKVYFDETLILLPTLLMSATIAILIRMYLFVTTTILLQ